MLTEMKGQTPYFPDFDGKRKTANRRAVFTSSVVLLALCGCQASDSRLASSLDIGFSYCRFDETVTLTLRMENQSGSTLYAWNELEFLVNGQRHPAPFAVNQEWKQKPFLPNAPKWKFHHMTNEELAKFLGPGEWTMQWKFGPVLSNSAEVAVHEDGRVQELAVECEPRAEEVARAHAETSP